MTESDAEIEDQATAQEPETGSTQRKEENKSTHADNKRWKN